MGGLVLLAQALDVGRCRLGLTRARRRELKPKLRLPPIGEDAIQRPGLDVDELDP